MNGITSKEYNKLPMEQKINYKQNPETKLWELKADEKPEQPQQPNSQQQNIRNSIFNNSKTQAITSLNSKKIDSEKAKEFQIGEKQSTPTFEELGLDPEKFQGYTTDELRSTRLPTNTTNDNYHTLTEKGQRAWEYQQAIRNRNNQPKPEPKPDAPKKTNDDKWLNENLGIDYDWSDFGYSVPENGGLGLGQIAAKNGKNSTGDEMIVDLLSSGRLNPDEMKSAVTAYLNKGSSLTGGDFKRLERLLEAGVDVDKYAPELARKIYNGRNDGSLETDYNGFRLSKLRTDNSGVIPITRTDENGETTVMNDDGEFVDEGEIIGGDSGSKNNNLSAATHENIANAKPGDKFVRSDGTVVTVTQADIDYSKNHSGTGTGGGSGNGGTGETPQTPEETELENIGNARTETIEDLQGYRDDDNFAKAWDDYKKQFGEELDEIDPATKRQVYQSAWSMYKNGIFGQPGSKDAKLNMGMAIVSELGKFMSGLGANIAKLGGHDLQFNTDSQIDTIRKMGVENAMNERNKFNLARMEKELENAGYTGERLKQIQLEIDKFATNPEYNKYFNKLTNSQKRMAADISMQIADVFGDSTDSQRLGLMLSNQLSADQYNAVAVREALNKIKQDGFKMEDLPNLIFTGLLTGLNK